MNMKSFSRIHPGEKPVPLEAWTPPEFDEELETASPASQAEQILNIFRGAKENRPDNNAGSRSALRPQENSSHFPTWQPGEMGARAATVREVEWTFLDGSQLITQKLDQGLNSGNKSENSHRRETLQQEKEARLILEQARRQADEIILAAQAEADNVLLQVQEEIDEQKREGFRQGWREATSEIEESMKATRIMVSEVHTWQTRLMSQGEQILIEMLRDISQKIFGEGVELNTNALQLNLNRIMENAQGLGDLNIFLNPRDVKNLDPSWSEYQMLITGNRVKSHPVGQSCPRRLLHHRRQGYRGWPRGDPVELHFEFF